MTGTTDDKAATASASARPWQSLRWRLALLGTLAIYVPVLLVFGVTVVTEEEVTESQADGTEITSTGSGGSDGIRWAVLLTLGPVSATLAWWWAGRAMRPMEHVRAVADDIEASDLGRRIALTRGPTEVVALAGSFDAMLDRLDAAAHTQRRLIEEASHELRTPLSLLRANAEVLLAHPDPDAAVYREGLERSRAAALRLQATIDELLVDARGRARTLDRRPADLAAVVRGVADDARVPAAARDVDLVVEGPATLLCSLDEPTVRRAVANLVDNAVRHAPAGTAVTLAVAAPADDDTTDAAHVAVTVTDHGPGIPVEYQPRIFDRFWQAPGSQPGTAGTRTGTTETRPTNTRPPETRPGAASEADSTAETDTDTGAQTDTGADTGTETSTGAQSDTDTGTQTGAGPETQAEVGAGAGTEAGAATEVGAVARPVGRVGGQGGAGLGLAIARHVARAHGGDVRVTSPGPDGDGAVFTLTLRR